MPIPVLDPVMFPQTTSGGSSGTATELLNAAQKFQDWAIAFAPSLVGALLTLILGIWVCKMVRRGLAKTFQKSKMDEALARFLSNIAYYVLVVMVLLAALGKLGVETTSFIAVIGAAGLAIGFALQGSLGNMAAGVMILLHRPFKLGDYVEAGGQAGSIEDIGVFATVMKTPDNRKIILPNASVTGGAIVNYSANDTRRVDMVFGISYGDDISKAKEIVKRVLGEDDRILKEPAPTVALSELADSSLNFVVRPWCRTSDYWSVRFDMNEKVKEAFDRAGISIPFPQRDVHLYQKAAS